MRSIALAPLLKSRSQIKSTEPIECIITRLNSAVDLQLNQRSLWSMMSVLVGDDSRIPGLSQCNIHDSLIGYCRRRWI